MALSSLDRQALTAVASLETVTGSFLKQLQSSSPSGEWLPNLADQLQDVAWWRSQPESIREAWHNHSQKWGISGYAESLAGRKIRLVEWGNSEYPVLLCHLAHPPLVLWLAGTPAISANLPIAVIGTRKMTAYGKTVTQLLTQQLVAAGATIISGFMYGVDFTAQQSCIEAGGQTVGVLGYGFDHIYPKWLARPWQDWINTGQGFISSFRPSQPPLPGLFAKRNELVAALSQAVVVTEAAAVSGTQITVRYALDMGKAVGAVPGPISNPFSQGTKQMINEGAVLVTSAEDILQELPGFSGSATADQSSSAVAPILTAGLDKPSQDVLSWLTAQPLTFDQLLEIGQQQAVTVEQLASTISLLELDNWLIRDGERMALNLRKTVG